MICKLYLSKVLKVSHETKSTLTRNGLVTVIIFKDLNMQAALININPRDNTIQLGINDGEWDKLSDHVIGWNRHCFDTITYTYLI